jgi:outer membrane protein OmpA-like peptidoglycan-associated protein
LPRRPAWLVSSFALLLATPAAAQVRPWSVEVSPFGGIWEGDAVLDNAAVVGARAGFNFTRVVGIEATYGAVFTTLTTDDGSEDKTVSQVGLNALLNLSDAALVPYLTAGAGLVNVEETDFATNVGLGARYYFTDMIGARVDFRGWFSPDAPADDNYSHFEATAGLALQFGGDYDIDDDGVENRADKCPTRPEDRDGFRDDDGCPDEDNDADGILDATDKCPDQAEDKDGDRDDDGCPDLDDDADGIQNENDKCPAEAEDKDAFQDEDGCPDPDNDADGILDAADKCPGEAEDKDGFEDDDGCPEADNDGDGIPDATDKCPTEAEDKDGDADDDGCPDLYQTIVVREDRIELKQTILFANGRDKILPPSFPLLNEVAQALKDNPAVSVSIEGHTDDKGDAKRNLRLSQRRADAVRKYLIEQGIAAERLEAKGFGEERPLQDNKTEEGRAANRRVEFNIVKKEGAEAAPATPAPAEPAPAAPAAPAEPAPAAPAPAEPAPAAPPAPNP